MRPARARVAGAEPGAGRSRPRSPAARIPGRDAHGKGPAGWDRMGAAPGSCWCCYHLWAGLFTVLLRRAGSGRRRAALPRVLRPLRPCRQLRGASSTLAPMKAEGGNMIRSARELAPATGLEPVTCRLTAGRSAELSYAGSADTRSQAVLRYLRRGQG